MRLIIYLLLLSMIGIFFSCYDDKSNMDYALLESINIDVSDLPASFTISQYGHLKIAPLIYKKGVEDNNLTFKWQLKGQETDKEIGRGMVLDTIINDAPQTDPYKVLLTVTDNTTGISELKTWDLTVLNSLREGLIVADTRDGVNTDLSLIMAFNFTGQLYVDVFRNDTVMHNLYSRTNGHLINDLALALHSASFDNNRSLTLLCQKSVLRINLYTYKYEYMNNDLFYAPFDNESQIKPQDILFNKQYSEEVMLINGLLYRRSCQNGEVKYSYQFTVPDNKYAISHFCITYANPGNPSGFAYDSLNGRFLMMPRNAEALKVFLNNVSGKFDPNNVGDKECLFMGEAMNNKVYSIMHERNTVNYYIYPFLANTLDDGKSIPLMPIDISGCTDIAKAKYFATSQNDDVLYYATEDKIYAAILTTNPVQSPVRYPDPLESGMANEKITSMQIWKEDVGCVLYLGSRGDVTNNGAYRMLVVTTCDGAGNGKVITMPIQNLGIGNLADPSYFNTFSGFGRILTVQPQVR